MQRTIRQHYVPRFYLKKFATEVREDVFLIQGFDLDEKRSFTQTIENVAVETKGYDIDLDEELLSRQQRAEALNLVPEDPLREKLLNVKIYASLEDGLAEAERGMAAALNSLIQHQNFYALSRDERIQMALFVALLYVRTPKMRQTFFNTTKVLMEKMRRIFPQGTDHLEFDEKRFRLMWLMKMEETAKEFAVILYNMKWTLSIGKFGAEIHTNDNPVLIYNPTPATGAYGNAGLAHPDIQMFLPITPYMLLNMHWENNDHERAQEKFFDYSQALFIKSELVGFADKMLFARNNDVFDVRPDMKRNTVRIQID